jgi:hypothetical protein
VPDTVQLLAPAALLVAAAPVPSVLHSMLAVLFVPVIEIAVKQGYNVLANETSAFFPVVFAIMF